MTKESFYIITILLLIAAVVILVVELSVQRSENKEYLGRRDRKDKPKTQPKQQTEPAMKHNGICLTCYFKNDCSVAESDIFRDDTGQVADCELYMKAITSKEKHNDTEMQEM